MWKEMLKNLGKAADSLSTGVYILVAVVILGIVNWFVLRYNHRLDLTPTGQYSLSLQTERVLDGLEQNVNLYMFDQPGDLERHSDLLDTYAALSPHVTAHFINLDQKPSLGRQFGVRAYGTLIVQVGERQQEASGVTEEEITNTLIGLLKDRDRIVYFLQAHGEADPDGTGREGFSQGKKLLEDSNFQVKTLSLLEQERIPEDCTILLVAGPRKDYLEHEIEALRGYVESGGRALFLLGTEDVPNLEGLLAGWGVELQDRVVVDRNPLNRLFGGDALLPLVRNFPPHVVVRDLEGMATIFPLTRTLLVGENPKEGVDVQTLIESSPQSWTIPVPKPNQRIRLTQPADDELGPFTLAVAATVSAAADGPHIDTGTESGAEKIEFADERESQGRLIVVGTSLFAGNGFLQLQANDDLFLNMMNWLSADEDLISIRPKLRESQNLDLTQAHMTWIGWGIFWAPIFILFGGFLVWWDRR